MPDPESGLTGMEGATAAPEASAYTAAALENRGGGGGARTTGGGMAGGGSGGKRELAASNDTDGGRVIDVGEASRLAACLKRLR